MSESVERVIYQFWTGDNQITENRLRGVEELKCNAGVPVVFLDKKGIADRILPDVPLHPAYPYLNEVKQSDYLRCYFLHHFGGGYADIKHYSKDNNWAECFDLINTHSDIDVIGQAERVGGAAFPKWNQHPYIEKLVMNSYFIVRPKSTFSTEWWNLVNEKLDSKFNALRDRPSTCPRERSPEYALRWAELQGEIFHELCLKHYDDRRVCNRLKSGREYTDYQ